MKAIDVKSADDLQALEGVISKIRAHKMGEEIEIRLARRPKVHLFKESRLVAMLATAAQHGRLTLHDWHSEWKNEDADEYFRNSVASLAAAAYAARLTNAKGVGPPFSGSNVIEAVAHERGILEPHNARSDVAELVGKSLSFCAFDPEFDEPLSLSGLVNDKNEFVKEFIRLKRRYLEMSQTSQRRQEFLTGDTPNASASPEQKAEMDLARYVFELYQNGYEHGRLSETDQKIPGLRFICIRRIAPVNEESAAAEAKGFPQLAKYLQERAPQKNRLFYEVSISDQGLGVLRRFLAKRPEFMKQAESPSGRLELLQRLLTEGLTGKVGNRGAGYGLQRALEAVKKLHGFVSLRTDSFWLFGSFPDARSHSLPILSEAVPSQDLAPVAGTHFNALIPLKMR